MSMTLLWELISKNLMMEFYTIKMKDDNGFELYSLVSNNELECDPAMSQHLHDRQYNVTVLRYTQVYSLVLMVS